MTKNLSQAASHPLQKSLVLVKPDGVRRSLTGEVLKRIERAGLKLVALKMVHASRSLAEQHYTAEDIGARLGERIRTQLLDYVTEGPIVAVVFEGVSCAEVIRKLCGSTEPAKSAPGTIRGDYCHQTYAYCDDTNQAIHNVVHASANAEDAEREVALWFSSDEIFSYSRADEAEHFAS